MWIIAVPSLSEESSASLVLQGLQRGMVLFILVIYTLNDHHLLYETKPVTHTPLPRHSHPQGPVFSSYSRRLVSCFREPPAVV